MSTQPFQAEVRQLLDIVIHSLYTDREIFIRELVSNASDAMEKLRHLQLTGEVAADDGAEALEISLTTDEEKKVLTIADRGIGLTREELVQNLGTIAHSGTKAFLQAMKDAGGASPSSLIGKFGVGFYSVFMAAESVTVYTRSHAAGAESLKWVSDGQSGYTIETAAEEVPRGCRIEIKLKEEAAEFANKHTVQGVLERYSNFVPFPIQLDGERINKVEALWLKSKNEITDEQYKEFYQFTCHAWDEPRYRLHFTADAPLQINSILFVPTENREFMGMGQMESKVSLYCRRVLIASQPPDFLPEWMRFLGGVVDSEDLPLNISRESMQDSSLVKKLGDVVSRRLIKHLEQEGTENPEKYADFYRSFSRFIKEGVANDFRNRESLPKLLRFESSMQEASQLTSLEDYVKRMKEGQEHVYYQIAPSRDAIEQGPYLEAFKARGLEVLFMYEPIDDYVMSSLREFDGKKFLAVDREEAKLEDMPIDSKEERLEEKALQKLCLWMKDSLGTQVSDVAESQRLVEHPILAVTTGEAPSASMRAMMRAMNQPVDSLKVKLEVNPRHPLIKGLSTLHEKDQGLAQLVASQLLDNALLSAGLLDDPRAMGQRMNEILAKTLAQK
jgi:TNF receptor-associated protein 1